MNARLEKVELFLVKQQVFFHQLFLSLQEVKPSDASWSKTLKTLESQIPVFTNESRTSNQDNQPEITLQNKSLIADLQNEINILKENEKNYRLELHNNHEAILKLQSSVHNLSKQTRENANSHSSLQSQLNLDQRLNEQATDLSIVKSMLKNQAVLWSEFESTIQTLVTDNGDESSNSPKPAGKASSQVPQEKPRSQLLQCQIRNLTYEIKKVRQEISIFTENQDKLAREKSLDIPNRINKMTSDIEQLRTTMMDMQETIQDHQQTLNSIESYHKIERMQAEEFQKETRKVFSTINDKITTIQTSIKATNDDLCNVSDRVHTVERLFPTIKCFKHELKQIKQQTKTNATKSEALQQRLTDLIRIFKQAKINQMKAQLKSLQDKSEQTQHSIDQLSTETQQISKQAIQLQESQKKLENRTDKIEIEEEVRIKEIKSAHDKIEETRKRLSEINNSIQKQEDEIKQIFKDLQNSTLQNDLQDIKSQTDQLFKLLEGINKRYPRDRLESKPGLGQLGINSTGPLSMSMNNFAMRESGALNSSGNGPDESDENIFTQNSSGIFDDLSGPIQMKTRFDDFDDLVEGIQMITNEQNRQRKVMERLVDSMKAHDIRYSKIKYHDKMIQEMRNRTSEHQDAISAIRNKQSTQEKNLAQVIKTVRYIETLNIGNEFEVIKRQIRTATPGVQPNIDSIQIEGIGPFSNLIAMVQKNTKRLSELGKLYNTMDADLLVCQKDVEALKKGNPSFATPNSAFRKVRSGPDQVPRNPVNSQSMDDEAAIRGRKLIKTLYSPNMLQNSPK